MQKRRNLFITNYRPIALLNVIYKLLASVIQARIISKMDEALDENQFGFRKGKSTAPKGHDGADKGRMSVAFSR